MSINQSNIYIEQLSGEQSVNYPNKTFLPLKEYEKCVKKVISKYFRHISKFLLKNEEIIANLVTSAIMADWRFDGRGSIGGYRVQCVKWAIQKTLVRIYSTKKFTYLGSEIKDDNGKIVTLLDIIIRDDNYTDIKESMEHIFSSKELTQKEKDRLRQYFFEDMTYKEIGQKEDLCGETIRRSIKDALAKIKVLMMK
jgi:RNA polymerase sigma factor (sigma-70 family)